ncbi:MAG: hypothetical protein JNK87_41945 [Bryobacterales bacterium]|nr:hypothetical protein [Bryobacterales bacterium]
MTIAGISSVTPGGETKPKDLKEAAEAFEGLLLAEMLRSVREAGGSSIAGGEGDASASGLLDHAESMLATHLSKAGGLGLSSAIVNQFGGKIRGNLPAQKEHSIGS